MKIIDIKEVDEELMESMDRLIVQLNPHADLPDRAAINEIIQSHATVLLMVKEDGHWAGSLSLVIYDIPTGRQARIEDVVVDNSFRGRGIGKALMEEAIKRARGVGAKAVSLTSRPSRIAANQLYVNMGFERHETNVYMLRL
jgi:ribosomal protein S18 acetylase RimI-like enzyme